MSDQSYMPRYSTFSPVSAPEPVARMGMHPDEAERDGKSDRLIRSLTWVILSVCLALWAVIGFVFWIPLLIRSMLRFSVALSQSMLKGEAPVESGRILRDTVGFYRRGFVVAVEAVFGKEAEEADRRKKKPKAEPLSASLLFREMGLAVVFWYVILFFTGAVEVSFVEGWVGLYELPWGQAWYGLLDWATGLFA